MRTIQRIQKGNENIIRNIIVCQNYAIFRLLAMLKCEVTFWIFYSLAEIIKRNQADGGMAKNLRREVKGTAMVV